MAVEAVSLNGVPRIEGVRNIVRRGTDVIGHSENKSAPMDSYSSVQGTLPDGRNSLLNSDR